MATNKNATNMEKGKETADRTLREEKNNPAVKQALKKEKQPETPDDLSPLHNTEEVGTSGGDQRATEKELRQDSKSSGK